MSIFKMSKSDKIFLIKSIIISVIIMISIISFYEFVIKDSSSVETKEAKNYLSQQLDQSKVPLYYEFRCIGGIAKIKQCDGKYFEKLVQLLESKNIHKTTGGIYMKHEVSFILHYYAGPPTKCIENICPKYTYYVQMNVQYKDEILADFSIKHKYEIEHNKDGIHGNIQLEKIEDLGPLKFKQTEKLLIFLGELSKQKQIALVK